MVRKKLATVVAALGTLQAGFVSALGIGELSLQSALNQPFVAEIKLLNVGDLDESQILVGLAGPDDFSNAGVSRDFFLTNLKFKVQLDPNGNGVIKLTSKKPVIEPYLNFLIETRWPSGRLLREYTVLLDLPVFSESQAKPVQSARSAPIRRQNPVARQPDPEPIDDGLTPLDDTPGPSRFGGDLEAGGEYRVSNDDTLWVIAAKARPSRRVSVQQTMLGIQRLNPSAFTRNNINRLKAGSVLRLPTEDDLQEISRQEAVSEVASQNRSFRNGDDGLSSDGAQLDATANRSDSGGRFREVDRLSIATAGNSDSDNIGDGQGLDGVGTQALRDRLTQNQETLQKTSREKQELQSRLDEVQAKLATLQRLVELKDDQLAAMQGSQSDKPVVKDAPQQLQKLDTAQDTGGIQSLGATVGDTLDQEAPMDAEQAIADGMAQQQSSELEVTLDAEVMLDDPTPAPAEPGLLDKILDNLVFIGGAILVLLGAAVVIIRRRRDDDDDDFDMDDELQSDELAAASFNMDDLLDSEDEDPFEEKADMGDQLAAELEEEIAADNAAEVAATANEEAEQSAAQVQPETGDAIAEADIYVAYGRYQQAVDLLRSAINQEPQRSDLQVKLLEVYVETRDKPGFQQQYMQLNGLGDDSSVVQVKEMLSTVDGVADWLDDLPDSASAGSFTDADMDADLIEGEEEFDLGLDDGEFGSADADLDLGMGEQADAGEFDSLDLDLDMDEAGTGDSFNAGLDEELGDIGLDLDGNNDLGEFDLDLDDNAGELTFDMDDMDLNESAAAGGQVEENSSAFGDAEGFELDLDDDDDFDLDFAGLGDGADLGDLESEFGDTRESAILPENGEPISLDTGSDDLDIDLDLTDGAEEDMDFSTIQDGVNGEQSVSEGVNGNANGEDFDFLSDADEVATKLDLARAYIDMGDSEGAKDILDEVLQEGNAAQKQEADSLIERID